MKDEIWTQVYSFLFPEPWGLWKTYIPVHFHNSNGVQQPYLLITQAQHVTNISGYQQLDSVKENCLLYHN